MGRRRTDMHDSGHGMTTSVPACCGGHGKVDGGQAMGDRIKDPVCGMDVDPASTPHHAWHHDREYHFCSAGCRSKFIADPEAYLGDVPRPVPQAAPGAI